MFNENMFNVPQNKEYNFAGVMAQVVEYLRTNYRALNSNLNTAKKKSTN
jgi:hypothetical protein